MWQLQNKTNMSNSIGLFLFSVVLTAKYHQYKHDTQQEANSEHDLQGDSSCRLCNSI
jgi:hypothetical protein